MHHAAKSIAGFDAKPSSARPAASTRFEATSTPRPPKASIARPAAGPVSAITTSETEHAPKTVEVESPSSAAIGCASIAMRYVDDAHAIVWVKPSAITCGSVRVFGWASIARLIIMQMHARARDPRGDRHDDVTQFIR